jgi:hypothetical protein
MLTVEQIAAKVELLKQRSIERDQRMGDVLAVRQGKLQDVFFGQFSDEYPKPLIANMVDVAARDLAETSAPLPSFNCSSSNMMTKAARDAADKRTKIANHYVNISDLQLQNYTGQDWYYTYGFCPAIIDLDFDRNTPIIKMLDPMGVYYEKDRFGNVTCLAQLLTMPASVVMYQYPEFAQRIRQRYGSNTLVTIVRYHDKNQDTVFVPTMDNAVLSEIPNITGICLADVAERPTVDGVARGQFDDVLPVQMAKARFALLQLEAAKKSVDAPIAIPPDVQEFALGPDALLRSNTPERIRRVPIELPAGVLMETQSLERELRMGSRYPEARTGNIDASIVTGQGVKALQGGFDSQIRGAQAVFARFFQSMISKAFQVDEKVFGDMTKEIRGTDDGTPYMMKYTPTRDIKGDYTVDVQYGLLAGLDPNRATIMALQLRGDKVISRELVRRNLPFQLNVTQEEQRIDTEDLRDSLRMGVQQLAAAIPQIAAQGGDPIQIVSQLAKVIEGRQKGVALEKVVMEAFAPEQPAADQMAPGASQPPMGVPGAAPAAGTPVPQGPPPVDQLLAALTGAA